MDQILTAPSPPPSRGARASAATPTTIGPEIAVTVPVRGASGVLGAVVVAVPAQPTDSRIQRAWLALGGFAVVLLGVAALLGLWLARGLSRPLLALEEASGRLGRGDLAARAAGRRSSGDRRPGIPVQSDGKPAR